PPGELHFVNTHSDSVLYATACTLLVAAFLFGPTRARLFRCVLFLPPLLMAMVANNRRLVWLEVGASLVRMLVLMPRNRITRQLMRVLVVASPVMLLYMGVGWNSSSRVFVPVAMTKSV